MNNYKLELMSYIADMQYELDMLFNMKYEFVPWCILSRTPLIKSNPRARVLMGLVEGLTLELQREEE